MLSLQFHITKIIKKTFITFIVLGIFVIFTKNALRIVNNDNDYNNYPWPKYLSTKIDNFPQDLKEKLLMVKNFIKLQTVFVIILYHCALVWKKNLM